MTKVGFHCIWKYGTKGNTADTLYFCMINYSNHQCKWCWRTIIVVTVIVIVRVSNNIWAQNNTSKDNYQLSSPNNSQISM